MGNGKFFVLFFDSCRSSLFLLYFCLPFFFFLLFLLQGPEYGRLHPKELFRGCGFYFSLDILFVSDISKIRDFSEVNWDSLELWQIVRSGGGIILGVLDSSLKQRMEFLSPPFEVDAKKKGRTELVQFLIIAKSDLSVMDALRLYARGAVGVMVDVSYLYDSASHGKLLEKEDHKIFRRKK